MATLTEVKPEAVLSNDEILRYSRHLIMPEVGMAGQQKLKAAKVLCIGAGGLGSLAGCREPQQPERQHRRKRAPCEFQG